MGIALMMVAGLVSNPRKGIIFWQVTA